MQWTDNTVQMESHTTSPEWTSSIFFSYNAGCVLHKQQAPFETKSKDERPYSQSGGSLNLQPTRCLNILYKTIGMKNSAQCVSFQQSDNTLTKQSLPFWNKHHSNN